MKLRPHNTVLLRGWWNYETIWDRLRRRKTFYYDAKDENIRIAYRLMKNGGIEVREFKPLKEKN